MGRNPPIPFFKREEDEMAITKIWKVENRLDNVVNYASDKSKTENKNYQNRNINSIFELLDYTTNPDKTEK